MADARRGMVADVMLPEPESHLPTDLEPAPVSVVIVNYNAGAVLGDCLAAVLPQVRQVVVVDNASDPAGFEPVVAAFSADPRLTVIRSGKNLGFATGCNLGVAACSEPTILLLNPDSVVHPGCVTRLCEGLHAKPTVGMVGGLLVSPDGSEQGGGRRAVPTPWRSAVRGFGLSRLARRWPKLFDDFYLHHQPLPSAPIAVEAISGACMALRRETFEAVGRLDEGYFLHCEDLDLCMRVRGRGWEILFVPDARVLHHKGVCSHDRRLFVEWHKHRGMMRFYRTHFRHQYPGGLMTLVRLGVWSRFAAIAGLIVARRLPAQVARGMVRLTAVARPRRAAAAVVTRGVASSSVAS